MVWRAAEGRYPHQERWESGMWEVVGGGTPSFLFFEGNPLLLLEHPDDAKELAEKLNELFEEYAFEE